MSNSIARPMRARLLTGALLLPLAACAVGPDFQKPAPPPVTGYTAEPLAATSATPGVAGGNAQHFEPGADIAADWWTLYHSPALNALIDEALKNNHDLKAAQAAIRVAHENSAAGRGAFFPAVTGGFSATRQLDPGGALAPVPSDNAQLYNLFTTQVSVSYTPDVFGLTRRTVEGLEAQERAARYQSAAAYTTLVNNVVSTAVQLGSVQMQIAATRQLTDANNRLVMILEDQLAHGYASGIDLAGQRAQAASIEATLPPLQQQEATLRHQLAVLVGRYPSQGPAVDFDLADLTLPENIPVTVPSQLVEQRPDVLAAEANLHAASAAIGVAVANRLPQIPLTGTVGNTALAFRDMFTPGTDFWNIGASLTAPLFDGGALLHQERGARANFDQVAEQYRSVVLGAFQNVADSLTALEHDADGLKTAARSEAAAKTSLDLIGERQKTGYDGTLALLNAEQTYQQARIGLIQAQQSRYADTAALFQALGGGWWHRNDVLGDNNAK